MRRLRILVPFVLLLVTSCARAQPFLGTWRQADLSVISSELSPAVMIHSTRPELTVFGNLAAWGLGEPAHLAYAAAGAVRKLRRAPGDSVRVDGPTLSEPWMLVWFQGGDGWSQWDSPWLVVWQSRPTQVTLDDTGLHASFPASAGYVAVMPLYGLGKPDTRDWNVALPASVIARCRLWARIVRCYPVADDETCSIDTASDSIVAHSRFTWLATADDWRTVPYKLAPISPTLALARLGGRMPMTCTGQTKDLGLFTAYGPYTGVPGTDQYDIRFPIFQYIRQTERAQIPDAVDPVASAALARLTSAMNDAFSSADGYFHQDFGDPQNFLGLPPQQSDNGNSCYAFQSAQYYSRALPYIPSALRAQASQRLDRYYRDWVLQSGRYVPYRGMLLLEGPGIGSFGKYGDAGKFSSDSLVGIWAYAQYTGNWDLIRERWALIKRLFVTPRECTWRGYGRNEIAEMGDEGEPALAMARMAYKVNDQDMLRYASYIFARELVEHVVKHTGAAYFVAHQPFQSMEPIILPVYLTNLWGDTAGWQIDGPSYPASEGERQYTNRWVRFGDPDIACFHRDYLQDYDQAELDGLEKSGAIEKAHNGSIDDPHILPSLVRLRSLLLDESPAHLAAVSPVDAPANPDSAVAAYCMSFLRTSKPLAYDTLIPTDAIAAGSSEGLSRDKPDDEPILDVAVTYKQPNSDTIGSPALTWFGWTPPQAGSGVPGGDRWSFGQIQTDRAVGEAHEDRLSWNTVAVVFGE